MSAARAYLSAYDSSYRHTWAHGVGVTWDPMPQLSSDAARAEARAILEQTEREVWAPTYSEHDGTGCTRPTLATWHKRIHADDTRSADERALAESLAAVLPVLDALESEARQ